MHVHVDQAGKHGHVAEIEPRGVGRGLHRPAAGGDGGDAAVDDEQLGIALDAAAAGVEQAVGADDGAGGLRIGAGPERQGEDEGEGDRAQRRLGHGTVLGKRCSSVDGMREGFASTREA